MRHMQAGYVCTCARDDVAVVRRGSVQNMDSGLWTGLMDWTVD